MKERTIELWPLWSQTERTLRTVLDEILTAHFRTPDWAVPLVKAKPGFSNVIQKWTELREREKRAAGQYASERLLDFSHPKDLFQVVDAFWPLFQGILGKSQTHWRSAADVLAMVRTPLAHSRPLSIDEGTRRQAEGHCILICDCVARWRAAKSSLEK